MQKLHSSDFLKDILIENIVELCDNSKPVVWYQSLSLLFFWITWKATHGIPGFTANKLEHLVLFFIPLEIESLEIIIINTFYE